jgi:hypothetical protein
LGVLPQEIELIEIVVGIEQRAALQPRLLREANDRGLRGKGADDALVSGVKPKVLVARGAWLAGFDKDSNVGERM